MVIESKRRILRESRLRRLLEKDRAIEFPATRNGKINRSHYARLLSLSQSAIYRFANVFSEYEKETQIIKGPMRRFPEMQKWMHDRYELKQLNFNGDCIDRRPFESEFGLRGKAYMAHFPAIGALIRDFDTRAIRDNYISAAKLDDLDRLRRALADDPELNKDRLTINKFILEKSLPIPSARYREAAFSKVLKAKEAEILEAAKSSKIDPYFHGRVFCFSILSPIWSIFFLGRVGAQFKKSLSGANSETVNPIYQQIINSLKFIGASTNHNCQRVVKEVLDQGRITGADDWEDALHTYRDHLQSRIDAGTAAAISIDTKIKSLRTAITLLSSGGIVPDTSVPLPGVRLARQRGGHLRSLAEAKFAGNEKEKAAYLEFAQVRFREVCNEHGNLIGTGESKSFIDSLASEIGKDNDLHADASSAIRRVLEKRIDALRNGAIAIVDSAVQAYESGRELLSIAQIDGRKFERDYFSLHPKNKKRGRIMRALFPDSSTANQDQALQGLANFLGLIDQRYSGVPPDGGTNEVGLKGQFFARRYLAYGGMKTIMPMLIPAPHAVGAILTLYLLESGANVGVGRTLDVDCIETTDLEGHVRITGNKARARGKPIFVDLPEHLPAVKALQWFRSASERLRALAGEDSDRLFLMKMGNRVQLMKTAWYGEWFKAFASSTPGLEGLELTPSMLRPSVLLNAALSNDGRLAAGMAIAQHGSAVSQGYQNKFPTRILYDENVRRFQVAFETLVMSGIEEAATKLGVTAEQFRARVGELRPTGLGTFCRDRRGRPGETAGRCSRMDCWNECPNLLIIAEVEAIAALQIWRASLRAAQPDWERDRPERWDEVWLPWLCLTDVVAEKMSRGPLIKIWNAAIDYAANVCSQANFVPPRPW